MSSVSAWGFLARRWHDIGVSGWAVLLNLIPWLNILTILALFFIPGNKDTNEYGPVQSSLNVTSILLNKKNNAQKSDKYIEFFAIVGALFLVIYICLYK